jgi:hypothetical protein
MRCLLSSSQENSMNKSEIYLKGGFKWCAPLLIAALATGCGGGGGGGGRDPILGTGNASPVFTAESIKDVIAPRVIGTGVYPSGNAQSGAINVPTNRAITALFSEAMNPATISVTNYTLSCALPCVAPLGNVSYAANSRTAVFTPVSTLQPGTLYTATIKVGATDLAGNPLASDYVWTWTTGASTDTVAPTITSTNPPDLATGVCTSQTINATFNEPMDPFSITPSTFLLTATAGSSVTGVVSYDSQTNVASFNPAADLTGPPATNYTATVKGGASGVKDLSGNALAVDKVVTFTTAAAACTSTAIKPVALGAAASFGTFGGNAGMTNSGLLTVINGNIGTTAVSTAVTGFHDAGPGCTYTETTLNKGYVNGLIYTAAPPPTVACPTEGTANTFAIATQGRADALAAYNTLAGMAPVGTNPGANLAGKTVNPGVYKAPGGSFMIQGGDLTLDALGDANAVWVFQMASTLTVGGPGAAAPQSIILAGGAQAKNVFWQVGSAATINAGGGGTMVGTIISQAGAAFSTAGNVNIVTLQGRAISLGASVTLVNTVINVPQ